MGEPHDWDKVAALEAGLARGASLDLTPEVVGLLARVAREVGIKDVEAQNALRNSTEAATLLREVRCRIREGSRRLMRAISEANRRKDEGDVAGARKALEEVLAVEVLPLYRRHAEAENRHHWTLDLVLEEDDRQPCLHSRTALEVTAWLRVLAYNLIRPRRAAAHPIGPRLRGGRDRRPTPRASPRASRLRSEHRESPAFPLRSGARHRAPGRGREYTATSSGFSWWLKRAGTTGDRDASTQ